MESVACGVVGPGEEGCTAGAHERCICAVRVHLEGLRDFVSTKQYYLTVSLCIGGVVKLSLRYSHAPGGPDGGIAQSGHFGAWGDCLGGCTAGAAGPYGRMLR